jgi:ATP-binding cassette subfamily F protein 3
LLLLDEPTNHLDLEMRHALAMALQDFEGAMVVVSHDRHLLRLVTDTLWLVDSGRAVPFDGDLDDYATWLSSREQARSHKDSDGGERELAPDSSGGSETAEQRQARKRAEAERRQVLAPLRQAVTTAEQGLDKAAGVVAKLETSLTDETLYLPARKADLTRLLAEQAAAKQQLARLEEAWLETSEQLENAQNAE